MLVKKNVEAFTIEGATGKGFQPVLMSCRFAMVAVVMMGYRRASENLRTTRAWYQGIFARLSGDSTDAQLARVAFLALEGLFLMRVNGLDGEMEWDGFLRDVEAVLVRLAP